MKPLRVLMVASEIVPFAKVGGIADVVGSLPIALKSIGVDVRLAMPRYSVIPVDRFGLREVVPPFEVPLDNRTDAASVYQGFISEEVPVYFVENSRLYDRDGIYMFPDDAERFIFFCRAALEMCRHLDWRPDVVSAHDWQTAIVPNWLKTLYADDPFFKNTASVYTIHNLAYRGVFGHRVLEIAGLAAHDFVAHPAIAPGMREVVDFMMRGILYGDAITTVSERHAREIRTPEFGEQLDPILRARGDRLFGILNGIDYDLYNPQTDPHLAHHYSAESPETRRENKQALQRKLNLYEDSDTPLVGMISRLSEQKGIDLVREMVERLLRLNAQFVLAGTGDDGLQRFFGELQSRYPGRAAYVPSFSQPLESKIAAGCDIYLMPSRFEPAGTNQMIALRYGAVPVVRATGGLADTVSDFDPQTGEGNGFTFQNADPWELFAAVVRALETYRHRAAWRQVQQNGMRMDLSWERSAERYVEVFQFAVDKKLAAIREQQALAAETARTATILAALPAPISRLGELAYNLWWAWNPDAQALFESIDPALWHRLQHNPVKFLREVAVERVEAAAQDAGFGRRCEHAMQQFDEYMASRTTWYNTSYPYATDDTIAYLSAEFGLHESLPIYSGGLGVLAGDTCKEASDLGVPLVAVGFLYPQGFFRQQIDAGGRQVALDEKVNFAEVPAVAVRSQTRGVGDQRLEGGGLLVSVEMPGRTVFARLWRIQVGRVPLILMDTDVEQNAPYDRRLVAHLYRGDLDARLAQETVLGIGGVRAVRALGLSPGAWHMNEGHAAFLALELARERVQRGESFSEALAHVRAQTVFTTHTPVAAGHDTFPPELMDKYFHRYYPQLGLGREEFLNLAMHDGRFSMTVLALRLSGRSNAVSRLHGQVTRRMWSWLWPDKPPESAPILAITNGVHTATWLSPALAELYGRYLGADWYRRLDDSHTWQAVDSIPDEELWAVHNRQRLALVEFVRAQARERLERMGQPPERIEEASRLLDPAALTIGFARRFATYKRATLIFRDSERLKRMLNDPQRPVQVVFAGKAHPADEPAHEFIRQVYQFSQAEGFRGRIHLLEEYNMHSARLLVAGADVWLNNPRPPFEASGTSGMKAALNGVPNASVLDGWWAEGYNGANGWQIGGPTGSPGDADPLGTEEQDALDAESLYSTFEQKIVPLFYERDAQGIPRGWLKVMKEAVRSAAPQFSTRRMMKEYVRLWVEAMAEAGAV